MNESSKLLSIWRCQVEKDMAELVLPDGCRDLIATIDAYGKVDMLITGIDKNAYEVNVKKGSTVIGLRLKAGSRFCWERQVQNQMQTQINHLEACSALLTAMENRLDQSEAYLLQAIEDWVVEPDPLVLDFISSVNEHQSYQPDFMSDRSLRRKLVALGGAPPRYWLGLKRVRQTGLALLQSSKSLAEIAIEQQYSDQAHMSRDLKAWFGSSPKKLRDQQSRYWDNLRSNDAFNS